MLTKNVHTRRTVHDYIGSWALMPNEPNHFFVMRISGNHRDKKKVNMGTPHADSTLSLIWEGVE